MSLKSVLVDPSAHIRGNMLNLSNRRRMLIGATLQKGDFVQVLHFAELACYAYTAFFE